MIGIGSMDHNIDHIAVVSDDYGYYLCLTFAKKLGMLDGDRLWLYIATRNIVDSEVVIAANSLPPEANVALVYPDKPTNPEEDCVVRYLCAVYFFKKNTYNLHNTIVKNTTS
ncbi:ionotropic receptor 93a [Trichonephila clavipes]|nr:ionotropic receptor 93a [Trichonephila clavipes]